MRGANYYYNGNHITTYNYQINTKTLNLHNVVYPIHLNLILINS